MQKLQDALNIGGQIASGLTEGLQGIRDGDLQQGLRGLTSIGSAIGTAIGGPAVGAIVDAVGQGIQQLVALGQVLSDLFTGDSPARRQLAAGLEQTIAQAFHAGIVAGAEGATDWQDALAQSTREAVLGALIDAFIQASVIEAIFEPFIDEFTKLLKNQGIDAAFAYFDQQFQGALDAALSVTDRFAQKLDPYLKDTQAAATAPAAGSVIELPTALPGGRDAASANKALSASIDSSVPEWRAITRDFRAAVTDLRQGIDVRVDNRTGQSVGVQPSSATQYRVAGG